jgi:hypothetical protein
VRGQHTQRGLEICDTAQCGGAAANGLRLWSKKPAAADWILDCCGWFLAHNRAPEFIAARYELNRHSETRRFPLLHPRCEFRAFFCFSFAGASAKQFSMISVAALKHFPPNRLK